MPTRASLLTAAACMLLAAGPARSESGAEALRGVTTFKVSVPVFVSGSGRSADWDKASGCRVDRAALERHGTEALRRADFDALPISEVIARMGVIVAEARREGEARRGAPPSPESMEAIHEGGREVERLRNRATLYVLVGIERVEGGLCAAGMTAALRSYALERPVIQSSGERVLAPMSLWEGNPLALAVPAEELQRAVEERLDRFAAALVGAWRSVNRPR